MWHNITYHSNKSEILTVITDIVSYYLQKKI